VGVSAATAELRTRPASPPRGLCARPRSANEDAFLKLAHQTRLHQSHEDSLGGIHRNVEPRLERFDADGNARILNDCINDEPNYRRSFAEVPAFLFSIALHAVNECRSAS